jgi:hypothetical protein
LGLEVSPPVARSSSHPFKEPFLSSEIPRGLEYTLVLDLDETLVHFDPVRQIILTFACRNTELTNQDLEL